MGDLTRRNKPTPVQTRRKEPEQVIIDVPGASAQPAPQQLQQPASAPNITQNIFYISAPPAGAPASPPPPQQPAPPQEIHYYTTVHHAPRATGRRRGLSFLGSAAVVLGGLGCASAFLPPAATFAKPLAMAGLTAGGLGMLGSILFGRSGKGVPFLGLLISAAAFGLWLQKNDPHVQAEVQAQVEKIKSQVPQLDLGVPTNPAPVKPAAGAPAIPRANVAPTVPAADTKDTSIFGFDGTPNTTANAPSQPKPVVAASSVDAAAAAVNLESARLAAAKRMGIDYTTPKTNADKAWANLQIARAKFDAGSAELRDADQKWLDAKAVLDAIARRLRADPEVVEAESKDLAGTTRNH